MQNPDTSPGVGAQAAPDQEILVLEAKADRMSPAEIIQEVVDTTAKAREIENENSISLSRGQIPKYEDATKEKAINVQDAVRKVLLAATGRAPKFFDLQALGIQGKEKEPTRLANTFLQKLSENKITAESINTHNATYVHKLLQGIFKADSLKEIAEAYGVIRQDLNLIDPELLNKIRKALKATGLARGYSTTELNRLFRGIDELDREDPNERKILDVIRRDTTAKERLKLDEFYLAMAKPESFHEYYTDIYTNNKEKPEIKKRVEEMTRLSLPADQIEKERNRMAREGAAKEVQGKLIYLISLFYKPVLENVRDQEFAAAAREYGGGIYGSNPELMFKALTSKISSITRMIEDNGEPMYMQFGQKTVETYNPEIRSTTREVVPLREYQDCNYSDFMKQLRVIADTEKNSMEYGYNFMVISSQQTQGEKKFFDTIAQYATRSGFTTTEVDVINSVEYSELVEAAKIQMERQYKIAFAKARWQRDESFLREAFAATNKIDLNIRESLIKDYRDSNGGENADKYPEVIIDRCIAHARTMVFAKEFNLHLWASYADPNLSTADNPTYTREAYQKLAVFSPMDEVIRWGDIPDLNDNGEAYRPIQGKEMDVKDVHESVALGRKEFKESYEFGMAAFREDASGEKLVSAIAGIGNVCKGGGMDTWGGSRVQKAYEGWLSGLVDPNSDYTKLDMSKKDVMVDAWKRVENLGVNIIKNFNEAYVFEPGNPERMKELFAFWYDRYLNDPDGVGQAYKMGKNNQVKKEYSSRDEYVKYMSSMIGKPDGKDTFTAEYYKIMSVMLFERSPLEFICMEKPRLTQNGVTLLSQVQEKFHAKYQAKSEDVLNEAMSDLAYVEQRARMDSIKKMHEIHETKKDDQYNLYGDIKDLRSDVLKGKNKKGGYVIDDLYIRNVLEEQYKVEKNPDIRKQKIDRAIELYEQIKMQVKKPPENNKRINEYKGEFAQLNRQEKKMKDGPQKDKLLQKKQEKSAEEMKKKLEKTEGNMHNRMEWWAENWKDFKFGMTFSADSADQFLDRTRTGPDTIAQAAEASATTSEAVKKAWFVDMKVACKQAATGHEFKPLYEYMKGIKDQVDVQDMGITDNTVLPITVRRIINAMSLDDKALSGPFGAGALSDVVRDREGSVSQTYTGRQGLSYVWGWDKNDINDFINGAHGASAGMVLRSKEQVKKLKRFGRAGFFERLRRTYLPAIGFAALGLILFALYQGAKEKK